MIGMDRGLRLLGLILLILADATNSFQSILPLQQATSKRSLSAVRAQPTNPDSSSLEQQYLQGVAVLVSVPVAWGTFEVAVRYVYALDVPVPAFVFSLAYYTVAVVALGLAAIVLDATSSKTKQEKNNQQEWPIAGGLELGGYLFGGNLMQVVGLQTVPSDRAAFLLQLTTIFVPLVSATLFQNASKISHRTWLACAVALVGVGLMQLDSSSTSDTFFSWGIGESLVVLSAVSYTFHCLRLEPFARETSAVKLAACKAGAETLYSFIAVLLAWGAFNSDSEGFLASAGKDCVHFWDYVVDTIAATSDNLFSMPSTLLPALLAVVWTGLGPVAYTIAAQSYGQARVRPVTANLIYTIQPICTAIFAYLVLREKLDLYGYFGGAVIAGAVLLVVTETPSETSSSS